MRVGFVCDHKYQPRSHRNTDDLQGVFRKRCRKYIKSMLEEFQHLGKIKKVLSTVGGNPSNDVALTAFAGEYPLYIVSYRRRKPKGVAKTLLQKVGKDKVKFAGKKDMQNLYIAKHSDIVAFVWNGNPWVEYELMDECIEDEGKEVYWFDYSKDPMYVYRY